jgi:hypothetical protein
MSEAAKPAKKKVPAKAKVKAEVDYAAKLRKRLAKTKIKK